MIQINVGDYRSSNWKRGWTAFPYGRAEMMRWARTRAFAVAHGNPKANSYFASLPGGRTLSSLLGDGRIWVSYAYSLDAYTYGVTDDSAYEIAIAELACRKGRWTVLATLIHELAHVNGVGDTGHAAEWAALVCGLGNLREAETGIDDPHTPYEPGIVG